MLGFLNVVLGAGIAEGAGRAAVLSAEVGATVAHLLSVDAVPAWVGHDQIEWGGPHGPTIEGPLDQFAVAGRALIRSIGTCSFEAPVEDARRIGLGRW
jgi:predicted NUDIX family NTP pyrophosphohydrolase